MNSIEKYKQITALMKSNAILVENEMKSNIVNSDMRDSFTIKVNFLAQIRFGVR